MKKVVVIACIVLANSIGYGQFWEKQFASDLFLVDTYIKKTNKGVSYVDTDTYKGSPYNNPNYLPGNVYKNNTLLANNVALRYNAVADEMEIKESLTSSNDDARVLTKSEDIFVKIAGDIFVFVPYQGGVEKGGYFQVLYEGNQIQLFKKLNKKFTPEKKASSSIVRKTPAKFDDRPIYFLVTTVGKFYQFPKSKKGKFKVFGSNKDVMKKYAKSKNLDINNESDLQALIKYYDTIGGASE